MSSLAGALDEYTHTRHPIPHYNHHTSDDIEMSKNDSEAQDNEEEMEDDLFGNDNDVEEQKHIRSVQISELTLTYFIFFSLFPGHLHRLLLPARILSAYHLLSENGDRPWNMKKKTRLRKFQLKSRKRMSLFRISLFPGHPMAMSVLYVIICPINSF